MTDRNRSFLILDPKFPIVKSSCYKLRSLKAEKGKKQIPPQTINQKKKKELDDQWIFLSNERQIQKLISTIDKINKSQICKTLKQE